MCKSEMLHFVQEREPWAGTGRSKKLYITVYNFILPGHIA